MPVGAQPSRKRRRWRSLVTKYARAVSAPSQLARACDGTAAPQTKHVCNNVHVRDNMHYNGVDGAAALHRLVTATRDNRIAPATAYPVLPSVALRRASRDGLPCTALCCAATVPATGSSRPIVTVDVSLTAAQHARASCAPHRLLALNRVSTLCSRHHHLRTSRYGSASAIGARRQDGVCAAGLETETPTIGRPRRNSEDDGTASATLRRVASATTRHHEELQAQQHGTTRSRKCDNTVPRGAASATTRHHEELQAQQHGTTSSSMDPGRQSAPMHDVASDHEGGRQRRRCHP